MSNCQHLCAQPQRASRGAFLHQQFRRQKPKLPLALPFLKTAPFSYAVSGFFLLTETCHTGTAVSEDGCEAKDGHEAKTDL